MDRDTPVVLADFVLECASFPEHMGMDMNKFSGPLGMSYSDYRNNPVRISVNQMCELISVMDRELRIPYLGLAVGNHMGLTCYGMAGVSAMAQPTFGECLRVASRLCEKVFPPLMMEYHQTDTKVCLRNMEMVTMAPYSAFIQELMQLTHYKILKFLLGDGAEPDYIAFTYPEPKYSAVYGRFFNCKVVFNAPFNELAVSDKLARRELLLANRSVASLAEEALINSLPKFDLNRLPRKLRGVLVQSMGAFPSIEHAARKIGMSGRTLRRQLNSLGTNYQKELDQLRYEFSVNYLTKSNKPITDIALKLGYCDSSAFSNAFKKWTGMSPREFRKRNQLPLGEIEKSSKILDAVD